MVYIKIRVTTHNPTTDVKVNSGDITPLPPLRRNGDGVAFPKFQKYGVQAMETRIRQNGNAMN